MVTGVLLIFAISLVNGHGRIFWEDETLGWVLLRDPSWSHMLRAWRLGADGGGIFFYILGRAWFHVFGDSVVAFRLFTSTTFGLAFPVLWLALRRFYSVGVVAFAVFNTLFFSPPLTMHYMEGRFYGLLMLGTALALVLVLRVHAISDPLPRRWYVCAFAVHLLLTGSHVLGVVYSAFLVLAMLLLDHLSGRHRWRLYLAASSSWLLLLLERPALEATARVGKPHFWTKAPDLGQIVGAWSVFSPEIFTVLLLLLLSVAALLPADSRQLGRTIRANIRARLPIYVTAGCILAIPLAFLVQGLSGTWLFTDRYLQPVALGVTSLTAELSWCLTRGVRSDEVRTRWPLVSATASSGLVLLFASALLFWVFRHEAQYTPSVPDFTPQLTAHVPDGLPVVVEAPYTFTDLMSRPAGSQRDYVFLLDWQYALSAQAQRSDVTQFHLMQNWKAAGYYADRIQDQAVFLRTHDQFLVVSNSILGDTPSQRPERGDPIAKRMAASHAYQVRSLFVLDRLYHDSQRDTLWLVQRGNGALSTFPSGPGHCSILDESGSCN